MALDPRLIEYQQHVRLAYGQSHRQATYVGAAPLLVQDDPSYDVVVQSGSAIAWGAIYVPPGPIFPAALLAKPVIAKVCLDDFRWQTTWEYQMAATIGGTDIGPYLTWPTAPQFENPPASGSPFEPF